MKKDYLSILANLKESDSANYQPDDKILIVDGLNTFIRAYTVNPSTNENGIHVGGISGFLMSVGFAIKNIKPTRVIICFDGKGGSVKRRKLFPEYKAQRRVKQHISRFGSTISIPDEKIAMGQQLHRLTEYLAELPVTVMQPENIEADDAMAYICQQVYPKSHCYIMSSDKDFLQLVDDRVQVWSPTKKRTYFKDTILEDFEIPYNNFLIYRLMKGDSSDNIPGIKGVGIKSLKKVLPMLFENKTITIDDIVSFAEDNKGTKKIYDKIANSRDILELNYKLMQLKEVDIHGGAKQAIMRIVREPINRLVKFNFMKMILEDGLNGSFKNPDLWLRQVFSTLDAMADKTKE